MASGAVVQKRLHDWLVDGRLLLREQLRRDVLIIGEDVAAVQVGLTEMFLKLAAAQR